MDKQKMRFGVSLAVVVVVIIAGVAFTGFFPRYNDGRIDAFIAWEPYAASAVVNGVGDTLVNSSEIWPDHPCCTLAVRTGYLEKHPDTVDKVVQIHLENTRRIQNGSEESIILATAKKFTGMEEETIRRAMANIKYSNTLNIIAIAQYLQFLVDYELVTDAGDPVDFVDSLLDTRFLSKNQSVSISPLPSRVTLRIAYLYGDLHQLSAFMAIDEGTLDQANITAEVITLANGGEVMDAFEAGQVDMGFLGIAPAIIKSVNQQTDIKILAGVNMIGSSIVVKKDSNINSVTDLVGKRIAIPGYATVQRFLLIMALDQVRLKENDVILVVMGPWLMETAME